MLTGSTLTNLLTELRLLGMRDTWLQQEQQGELYQDLAFHDRFLLLLEAEQLKRHNHRLATRLRQARLHECVAMDTLDFRATRGLSKALCVELAKSHWVKQPQNILIAGAAGTGKTYLACALAHQACANLYTGRYYRLPRLLHDLQLAEHNGTLSKLLQTLARYDVLVLDDWALTPLTDKQRRYLLEVLDDRYHHRATVITSQLPVKHWHDYINEPTLADAILDRLIHGAQQIQLKGESLRRKPAQETTAPVPETTETGRTTETMC
jgi:DNA replication protein DnaC